MVASLSAASSIALSGIQAATVRVNASAQNIANSQTLGTPNQAGPFGADQPPPLTGTAPSGAAGQVFQALNVNQQESASGGVTATVTPSKNSGLAFQPDSPFADKNGLVATPDVDPARKAVNLLEARNNFIANVKVFQVTTDLSKKLIDNIS